MPIEHGAIDVHRWKMVELEEALELGKVVIKADDKVQLIVAQAKEKKVRSSSRPSLRPSMSSRP